MKALGGIVDVLPSPQNPEKGVESWELLCHQNVRDDGNPEKGVESPSYMRMCRITGSNPEKGVESLLIYYFVIGRHYQNPEKGVESLPIE